MESWGKRRIVFFPPSQSELRRSSGEEQKDLLDACAAAGEILARIQVEQGQQTQPLPVGHSQRDFGAA